MHLITLPWHSGDYAQSPSHKNGHHNGHLQTHNLTLSLSLALFYSLSLSLFLSLTLSYSLSHATPALDDFLVSLSPAQSESEKMPLLDSCPRISKLESIVSLPSSTERVVSIWKSCVVKDLTFIGTTRSRRMLCVLCLQEQASGHMRSVLADLFWVYWILLFHIVNCWSLHCISILEPQTLDENVNVPGIVLKQYPCLPPAHSPIQRFDTLRRTRSPASS